jgi:hypothetical protein
VDDQEVGGLRPLRAGNQGTQLIVDLVGVIGPGEPEALGYAEDVGVDGQGGDSEGVAEHHVGRLAADPGSVTSASAASGTIPPCRSTSAFPMPISERALALKKPVEWMARSSTAGSARA